MRVKDSDPHYNSLSYWLTVNILFLFLVASDADSVAQADPGMITFLLRGRGAPLVGISQQKERLRFHPESGGSGSTNTALTRAVDPHSLYADPDPAVFLNADPDPGPGPA